MKWMEWSLRRGASTEDFPGWNLHVFLSGMLNFLNYWERPLPFRGTHSRGPTAAPRLLATGSPLSQSDDKPGRDIMPSGKILNQWLRTWRINGLVPIPLGGDNSGVCPTAGLRTPRGHLAQLPALVICSIIQTLLVSWAITTAPFPSGVSPTFTFQINNLHRNLCLRRCFWETQVRT